MFAMDAPPVLPIAAPMIVVQATPIKPGENIDYVVKSCQEVEHASNLVEIGNVLEPLIDFPRLLKLQGNALNASIKLEVPPEHGELRRIAYARREELPRSQTSWTMVYANPDGSVPAVPADTPTLKHFVPAGEEYRYITTPGYHGKDRVVFSVEHKGKRYRIDLELIVSRFLTQTDEGSPCPAPRLIKVIPKRSDVSAGS